MRFFHFFCVALLPACVGTPEPTDRLFDLENVNYDVPFGQKRLRLVGSAFGGSAIFSRPQGLSCLGGDGPGCTSDFRAGSRVEITYPAVIYAGGEALSFRNYYCEGENYTTVTGPTGRRVQTLFMQESYSCTAFYGQNGGNTLSIVGSAYVGQAVTSSPRRIDCNGGNQAGCQANFPTGSRVELEYPQIVYANGEAYTFENYYCAGAKTSTVTGARGNRFQTLFLYEDFACTGYYR